MKIVFMGTPEFAAMSLARLYSDKHDIVAVFTQADKPKNRGMKMSASPVKELALSNGTPIYQPDTLKDEHVTDLIKSLNCDIIVVVAYGKILTQQILDIPALGCINIHGSILPKYRGAAPIQHAILNGEKETGVTSQYVAKELDSGDVIAVKKTPIGAYETSADLFNRLAVLGAELLSETLDLISGGKVKRTPQNDAEVTFAPLLSKEISPIDWNDSAISILNKVRALIPWPVATMELCGERLKIFKVEITDKATAAAPGSTLSAGENGIEVSCSDGTVIIKQLQAPGGKKMSASDYLRGKKHLRV